MGDDWNGIEKRNLKMRKTTMLTPKQLCQHIPACSPEGLAKSRQRGNGFPFYAGPNGRPVYCLEECFRVIRDGRTTNTVAARARVKEFRASLDTKPKLSLPRTAPRVHDGVPEWAVEVFQRLPEKICGVSKFEIVQGVSLYEHEDGAISITDVQLKEWLIGGSGGVGEAAVEANLV